SFAFETTRSGLGYLRHIEQWRGRDYHVSLFFLMLPSAGAAIARVSERVRQGGMTSLNQSSGAVSRQVCAICISVTNPECIPGLSMTVLMLSRFCSTGGTMNEST